MLLIVDYDNVQEGERRLGVDHLVRKSLSFCEGLLTPSIRVRARFYGGWIEAGRYTQLAQKLIAEIQSVSPIKYTLPGGTGFVLVDAQLALSPVSAPTVLVSNSYRRKGFPRGIRCQGRPWIACKDESACAIKGVEDFLANDVCGNGCAVRPADVLERGEQKVVDTLMVADLIFHAIDGGEDAVVVTRDDDIWPGLIVASRTLRNLFHISTTEASRLPPYFSKVSAPPYSFAHWS